MAAPTPAPLLSTRAALIVLIGLVAGLLVGVLGFLAGANVPAAILVGIGAGATAVWMSHFLIDDS